MRSSITKLQIDWVESRFQLKKGEDREFTKHVSMF